MAKQKFNTSEYDQYKVNSVEFEGDETQKPKKFNTSDLNHRSYSQESPSYDIDNYEQHEKQLGENFNVEKNLYQYGSLEEASAQKQSTGSKLANGVLKILPIAATDMAKGFGYMGGMAKWAANGAELDEFAKYVDNAFVKGVQGIEEFINDETLPVHTRREVANGNFARQFWSPEFWANDVSQGLSSLIGFMAPGVAMTKLGKTAGLTRKFSKAASKISNKTVKNALSGAAKNTDTYLATGMNTVLESAMEAGNMVSQMQDNNELYEETLNELTNEYQDDIEKEIRQAEFEKTEDAEGNFTGYTKNEDQIRDKWQKRIEEEAEQKTKEKMGHAGLNAFSANMALLTVPNYIMNKNIMGAFGAKSDDMLQGAMKQIGKGTAKESGKRAGIKNTIKKIVGGAASEGLIEEGGQFAVEQAASGGDEFEEFVGNIAGEYANMFGNTEGQKSMFIGALLGGVGGGIGSYRKGKQKTEQINSLSELLERQDKGFKNIDTNIWKEYVKEDENGNTYFEKEVDGNKEPVYDVNKIKENLDNIGYEIGRSFALSNNKEYAEKTGDDAAYRETLDRVFTEMMAPYVTREGGSEIFKEKLDSYMEQAKENKLFPDSYSEEKANKLKEYYANKAEKLEEYNTLVNTYGNEFFKLSTQNKEEKAYRDSFIETLKSQAVTEHSRQLFLEEEIDTVEEDLSKAKKEQEGHVKKKKRENIVLKEHIKNLEKKKTELNEKLDESVKQEKLIFNKSEQQKAFAKKTKELRDNKAEKEAQKKDQKIKQEEGKEEKEARVDETRRTENFEKHKKNISNSTVNELDKIQDQIDGDPELEQEDRTALVDEIAKKREELNKDPKPSEEGDPVTPPEEGGSPIDDDTKKFIEEQREKERKKREKQKNSTGETVKSSKNDQKSEKKDSKQEDYTGKTVNLLTGKDAGTNKTVTEDKGDWIKVEGKNNWIKKKNTELNKTPEKKELDSNKTTNKNDNNGGFVSKDAVDDHGDELEETSNKEKDGVNDQKEEVEALGPKSIKGSNLLAYQSRSFKVNEAGFKTDSGNSLNSEWMHLLNPEELVKPAKVYFKVTGQQESYEERDIEIRRESDDKLLGHVHKVSWMNNDNIAKDFVARNKEETRNIRKSIVFKEDGETVSTEKASGTIQKETGGVRIRTAYDSSLNKRPTKPTGEAITDRKTSFIVAKRAEPKVSANIDGETKLALDNERHLRPGYIYKALPNAMGKLEAVPIYQYKFNSKDNQFGEQLANTAVKVIKIAYKKYNGIELTPQEQEIVNTFKETIDFENTGGLFNFKNDKSLISYLNKFLYNTERDLKALERDLIDQGIYNTKDDALVSIRTKKISFTRVKQTIKKEADFLDFDHTNYENLDFTLNNLHKAILKTYMDVDANSLKNGNGFIYLTEGSQSAKVNSYYEYAEKSTYTDLMPVDTEFGKAYFSQPKIRFKVDQQDNTEKKEIKEETITEDTNTTTEQEQKEIGDLFDETEGLDLPSFDENESNELPAYDENNEKFVKENTEKFFVAEIKGSVQEKLVNVLHRSFLSEMVTKGKAVPSEVFKSVKSKIENYKAKFQDNYDKMTDQQKETADKRIQQLDTILDSWDVFESKARRSIKNTENINISKDSEVEQESGKENNAWAYEEIEHDPKLKLRAEVKMFLANTRKYKDGKPESFLGIELLEDFKTVFDTVKALTAGIAPDFDLLLDELEKHQDRIPFIKDVVERLDNDDHTQINMIRDQFVVAMSDHKSNAKTGLIDTQSEEHSFVDANQNDAARQALQEWKNNAVEADFLKSTADDVVYDSEKLRKIYKQGKALIVKVQEKGATDATKKEARELLKQIGIDISDNTWQEILDGNIGRNNSFTDFILKGEFHILFDNNDSILAYANEKTSFEDTNIFSDKAVEKMAQKEVENNPGKFNATAHKQGNKKVYSYERRTFLMNELQDLKGKKIFLDNDTYKYVSERAKERFKDPFSANSIILRRMANKQGEITEDNAYFQNFETSRVSLESYKNKGTKSKDDQDLRSITPVGEETFKVVAYDAHQSDRTGEGNRVVSMLYPTVSDKKAAVAIRTLRIGLDYQSDGNLTEEGRKEMREKLYDQLVLPELRRMQVINKEIEHELSKDEELSRKEAEDIVFERFPKEFRKGWNKFYFLPLLNELDGLDPNFETLQYKKDNIDPKLDDIFDALVDEKLDIFKNHKINPGKNFSDNVLGNVHEEGKQRALANDMVFNYLINNANMHMLFIGDPAYFFKTKSTDPIQQIKDTFNNVGKRLAKDMAPGIQGNKMDLETINYIFAEDIPVVSEGLKNIEELFGKESDEHKQYSGQKGYESDKADAQEWTTLSHFLLIQSRYGEFNRDVADRAREIIKEEIDKGNHFYWDKLVNGLGQDFLDMVHQPEKPEYTYTRPVEKGGNTFNVPVYVKSSAYPLLPNMLKGKEADKIRIAMEKSGMDRLAFDTAVKAGNIDKPLKLWKEGNSVTNSVEDLVEGMTEKYVGLSGKGLKRQQELPFDGKKRKVSAVTQGRKNLSTDIISLKEIKPLIESFKEKHAELFSNLKDELKEELGIDKDSEITRDNINFKKIREFLDAEADARGLSEYEKAFLELDEQLTTLPFSKLANQFESLLNSIVVNKIVKDKMPGKSYVVGTEAGYEQMSEQDFEEIYGGKYGKAPTQQILHTKHYNGKKLKQNQVFMPWNFRDSKGNLLPMTQENLDLVSDDLLKIYGFRIPNAKLSFQDSLEIAGFLPYEAGDLLIPSQDLVIKMGQDFDVDKLTTYQYHYFHHKGRLQTKYPSKEQLPGVKEKLIKETEKLKEVKKSLKNKTSKFYKDINEFLNRIHEINSLTKKEKKSVEEEYESLNDELARLALEIENNKDTSKNISLTIASLMDLHDQLKDAENKKLRNEIIDIHHEVLTNPHPDIQRARYAPESYGSLVKAAKDIEERRDENRTEKETFVGISDSYQSNKRKNASAASVSIGITANNTMLNSLLQNGRPVMYGYTTYEGAFIRHKIPIGTKTFNGFMSDKKTLNNENLKSKVFASYLAVVVDNENQQVMHRLNLNQTTFPFVQIMTFLGFDEEIALMTSQDIMVDFVKELQNIKGSGEFVADAENEAYKEVVKKYTSGNFEVDFNPDANYFTNVKNEYGKQLTPTQLMEMIGKGKNTENRNLQLAVLEYFMELKKDGSKLSKFQSLINTDSQGVGKSVFESMAKEKELNETLETLPGTFQNIDSILEGNTTIAAILNREALKFNNDVWKNFFPYAQENLDVLFYHAANLFDIDSNDAGLQKIKDFKFFVWEQLKSYIFTDPELGLINEIKKERRRLFYKDEGNVTLAEKIKKIQKQANNPFLNNVSLQLKKDNKRPEEILFRAFDVDTEVSIKYQEGFLDLILNPKEIDGINTQDVALDLIEAAYLTGGVQKAQQYIKLIPDSYLFSIPFFDKLGRIIGEDLYNNDNTKTEELLGKYVNSLMKKRDVIHSAEELPPFLKQMLRHYPEMLPKLQGVNEDYKYTDDNKQYMKLTDPDAKQKNAFAVHYTKTPKGKKNFIIFVLVDSENGIYKKIESFGTTKSPFSEYEYNNDTWYNSSLYSDKPSETTETSEPVKEKKTNPFNKPSLLKPVEYENQSKTKLPIRTGSNPITVLSNIENNSVDPYYMELARAFKNSPLIEKMKVVSDKNSQRGRHDLIEGVSHIVINPVKNKTRSKLEQTFLHEVSHGLTVRALKDSDNKYVQRLEKLHEKTISKLKEDGELKKQFEEIYRKYWEKKNNGTNYSYGDILNDKDSGLNFTEQLSRFYGLMDFREFVSMALTDPGFQRILNEIKDGDRTALDKFIQHLTKLLGDMLGIEIDSDSVLASAMEDIMKLVEDPNQEFVSKTKTEQSTESSKEKNQLFNKEDKEIKAGSAIVYKGKPYLVRRINDSGKLQLINSEGNKHTGTPNKNKVEEVKGNYPLTEYNGTKYIVTNNNKIYSTAEKGGQVYTGTDNSSKTQKENIIAKAVENQKNLSTFDSNTGKRNRASEEGVKNGNIVEQLLPSYVPSQYEIRKQFDELNNSGKPKLMTVTDANYKTMLNRAKKVNLGQHQVYGATYYKAKVSKTFGEEIGRKAGREYYMLSLQVREEVLDPKTGPEMIPNNVIQEYIKKC